MDITLGRVLTAASVVVATLTAVGVGVDSVTVSEALAASLALLGAGHLAE